MNEISARYSVMKDEFYVPAGVDIAAQSEDNKQGRATEPVSEDLQKAVREMLERDQTQAYETYNWLVGEGIAKELARINLPLSLYTEFYWQMDLHNLMHFLELRMHPHAQREIQAYASRIFQITKKVTPIACEAFEEHILEGIQLSGQEIAAVKRMIEGAEPGLEGKNLERFKRKLDQGFE